jgi:hypothetical protein
LGTVTWRPEKVHLAPEAKTANKIT